MTELGKNQVHRAVIEGYSSDGAGIARIGGRAVFVPGTIQGEEWDIRLVKVSGSAVFGRGETLLSPSPARQIPACPLFGRCGGCDFQHMSYEEELNAKLQRVNDALRRIGGLTLRAKEIHGAPEQAHYRNKGIYAFGPGPATGFFRSRSHQVLPVEHCLIQTGLADRAAHAMAGWAAEAHIPVYNETDGSGLLRHVFVRHSPRSGEAVACLVAAGELREQRDSLTEHLRRACPELTGVVLCVNHTRGNTVLTGDFIPLWGSPYVHEQYGDLRYRLSPQSFFQINAPQAMLATYRAAELARPEDGTVLDLYCGVGAISLVLARHAGKVIGAEIVPQAVENARYNAALNGLKNTEFLCADAAEAAALLARRGEQPKAVVVDPPRKGLSPQVIDTICSMAPERIVYVSCDPATLARDLKLFAGLGYPAIHAEAYDFFPRCAHVETVCLLVRRNGLHIDIDVDVEEMLQEK